MALKILLRIVQAILSMLVLSVLVFGLVRLTGDPLQLILPELATEEDFARARAELGLDKPLHEQYTIFISQLMEGDLGTSIQRRVPVSDLIAQRFPATLQLGLAALILVLLVGVPVGVLAAYWRGSPFDHAVRTVAAFGQSTPSFWIGLILILIVAVYFDVLPAGGYGGLEHMILPAITMSVSSTAEMIRLVRSNMIEVLTTDYVKFLRIKGVPERSVLWKHAFRNAGLSTLTFAGLVAAGLFTGSVLAETVFVWPGMGLLMVQSIEGRDYPVTQAVVLTFSLIYIVMNLVVDLAYMLLNPRVRA